MCCRGITLYSAVQWGGFVVKYGGSLGPPDLPFAKVSRETWFFEAVEINPVVVHGGGKAISRAMKKLAWIRFSTRDIEDSKDTAAWFMRFFTPDQPEIVATINGLGELPVILPEIFTCRKNRFRAKMVKGWILALWVR